MKFFFYLISLFSLSIVISCKQEKKKRQDNPIIINVKDTSEDVKIKNIIKDFYFVKLDQNTESFVSNIDKFFELDDNFVVFDNTLSKIIIFSKSGNFIRKIGAIGTGPGEYKDLGDMTIDYNNNLIQTISFDKMNILNYKINGEFSHSFKPKFPLYKFSSLRSGHLGHYIGYYSDDFYNLVITDKNNNISYEGFKFPREQKEDLMKSTFTGHITTYNDSFLYTAATSPVIYEISKKGIINKKYSIKFEKNPWEEKNSHLHLTFLNKIQKGQVSFLRSKYEENNQALVFQYNHSVTYKPKKRVSYPKIGFYLKESKKLYSHYNMNKNLLYSHISAPIGKSQNGDYFVSKILNLQELQQKIDNSGRVDNLNIKLSKILESCDFENENTLLFFYKFK